MKILGIESSAHTLGIGVFDSARGILANEKAYYKAKNSGIHPRKAADFLSENAGAVLDAAIAKSFPLSEFDGVAFTLGPGLGPCLQVGATLAKTISLKYDKPLIPVNHCVAHIEITRFITKSKDPIVVYVSGGNTQIISREEGRYRVLGETLDIGMGNMFDTFGRALKLEWAHGSIVEQLASKGNYFELPYTVKGMDLAFTGLITSAIKSLEKHSKEDVCKSLQETSFAMLIEATERAVALTGKKEVIACGGVAQNKTLQNKLSVMCEERGATFAVAPNEYNADNGAMIAYAGSLALAAGTTISPEKAKVKQRYRTDEVELKWK